jgi:hypothetical protein
MRTRDEASGCTTTVTSSSGSLGHFGRVSSRLRALLTVTEPLAFASRSEA